MPCAQLKEGSVTKRKEEGMTNCHGLTLPIYCNYNMCSSSVDGVKRTEGKKLTVKRKKGKEGGRKKERLNYLEHLKSQESSYLFFFPNIHISGFL